jgi:hypothetical protein
MEGRFLFKINGKIPLKINIIKIITPQGTKGKELPQQ